MACCVAANRTVQKLHRKEFVCRFLWLFLFGLLDGEGGRRRMSWQDSEIISLNLVFIAEMKSFNQQKGTHSTCTLEENFRCRNGWKAENKKETSENVTAAFIFDIFAGRKMLSYFAAGLQMYPNCLQSYPSLFQPWLYPAVLPLYVQADSLLLQPWVSHTQSASAPFYSSSFCTKRNFL